MSDDLKKLQEAMIAVRGHVQDLQDEQNATTHELKTLENGSKVAIQALGTSGLSDAILGRDVEEQTDLSLGRDTGLGRRWPTLDTRYFFRECRRRASSSSAALARSSAADI